MRVRTWQVILAVFAAGLALTLLLSSVASADLPSTVGYNPTIAAIISQITTQTLVYELEGLTGDRPITVAGSLYTVTTRNSYQTVPISMVTRYAYEQFAELGLVVTYHNYVWGTNHWRNVVAEKPGVVDPDEVYLITAHVDDMPSESPAPGADDNGSGSATVLMAARLLASRHVAYTVRFVLFTGEEQGLRGSAVYAADCKARGENIRGVVNLDMIGYNTGSPVFDAYARSGTYPGAADSRHLADIFSDTVGVYGLNLLPRRLNSNSYPLVSGSDQWSFLSQGYPAILVIEDYAGGDFTPYYHTTNDQIFTLDLDYCADLSRAAIATIARLALVLPSGDMGQLSGTVVDSDTGLPISGVTVAAYWPAYQDTIAVSTNVSGVYTLSLPVGTYTVTGGFSSPDYFPVVTNALILTDSLAIRDFALKPWLRFYLPLIANEG
jgi:hypothetical protein